MRKTEEAREQREHTKQGVCKKEEKYQRLFDFSRLEFHVSDLFAFQYNPCPAPAERLPGLLTGVSQPEHLTMLEREGPGEAHKITTANHKEANHKDRIEWKIQKEKAFA